MILFISISFPIPFCSLHLSFHSFTLSFYRTLYNLYLNPNLLKILSNYTYTIPKVNPISLKILSNYAYTISKVTTLHTYILTSCLIFFTHFHFSYFSFISIFLHISTFLYSFFYSPSYISISFIFPLCISILLSYFSYTLSCCASIDLTIFGYLYYHFNCKHCIMPSYCALLCHSLFGNY